MSDLLLQVRFRADHRWAPSHMSAYLDGDLASKGRGRLERHIGECDDCRRLLAGLRGMLDALRRLPPPTGDALELAASVRARLQARSPE